MSANPGSLLQSIQQRATRPKIRVPRVGNYSLLVSQGLQGLRQITLLPVASFSPFVIADWV